jgi:glutathione S-transferase
MLKLYDLAGRDERLRFSPYCWRTKMALKHKGLPFETTPWRFTEKDIVGGTGRVPTLIDGAQKVQDSWQIALYLDRSYPDRPTLMKTDADRTAAHFMNSWCDLTLHPTMRALVLLDVFNSAAPKDQDYFRSSREKSVGMTLEQLCGNRDAVLPVFLKAMAPAEAALGDTVFFGGGQPNYCDYALFGSLQWANTISGTTFLPDGTAAAKWFARMLDLYDGFARKAPTVRDLAT